jgi:hypothetical protein
VEGLNLPEFKLPNSTGAPAQVFEGLTLVTPPDAKAGDISVYVIQTVVGGSIDGQKIYGASINQDAYWAKFSDQRGYLSIVDKRWEEAMATVAGRTNYDQLRPTEKGTFIHSEWARLLEAEQAAGRLPENLAIEQNIALNLADPTGRYIRPVVVFTTDDGTLKIYVDGKSGNAVLSKARINQFIDSVGDKVQRVVVILQK